MASANREPQDDKKEDKRSSDRSKSLDTANYGCIACNC